ncbi:MAG: DUF6569 family protein [Nanoarchaeota archaeon]
MNELTDYIQKLEIGTPKNYKNITVIPLIGKNSGLDYMLLDEAISSGLRISETGSVPTLHFENNTGKEVLIMQGEYVVGGKQNRMITKHAYLEKGFNGEIPVSCVEQGRWSYQQPTWNLHMQPHPFIPTHQQEPNIRTNNEYRSGRKAAQSVCYAATRGQGAVWDEVKCLSANLGTHSATQNLEDTYSQKEGNINEYLSKFDYPTGAVGMIVVTKNNGNRKCGADIFDQSNSLKQNFDKLLESYVIEALNGHNENIKGTKKEAKEFLTKLQDAKAREEKAISLGTNYSIIGATIMGSTIVYKGTPLYLSFGSMSKQATIRPPEPWEPIPRPRPDPFEPEIEPYPIIRPYPFEPWRRPPTRPNSERYSGDPLMKRF